MARSTASNASNQLRFTSRRAFAVLSGLLLLFGSGDLVSGVLMMQDLGPHFEQNPIARTLFLAAGPWGLAAAKFATLLFGVWAFWHLAFTWGRPRAARACLTLAIILMMLGVTSNLVWPVNLAL